MKILVTGSGTNIGNNIAEKLLKCNQQVICMYHKRVPKNLAKFKKSHLMKVDLKKKILHNFDVDVLIHCASATPEKYREKHFNKINIDGFRKLLKKLNPKSLKKIILISSIAIYEDNDEKLITENTKPKFHSKYALSKFKQEQVLKNFSNGKIEKIILRLSSILSKNSQVNFFCKTVQNIKKNKEITLIGAEKKINSIFYVNDLTNLVLKLIKEPIRTINSTFNVVSSESMRLFQIIYMIYSKLKKNKKILFSEKKEKEHIFSTNKLIKIGIKIPTTRQTLKKFLRVI